jgi:hypothetical protein
VLAAAATICHGRGLSFAALVHRRERGHGARAREAARPSRPRERPMPRRGPARNWPPPRRLRESEIERRREDARWWIPTTAPPKRTGSRPVARTRRR